MLLCELLLPKAIGTLGIELRVRDEEAEDEIKLIKLENVGVVVCIEHEDMHIGYCFFVLGYSRDPRKEPEEWVGTNHDQTRLHQIVAKY